MTTILIIIAALSALFATLPQDCENDKVEKENRRLTNELLQFTRGSDLVPRLLASAVNKSKILLHLKNMDLKYPILNVRAKVREQGLPDIGTLYPGINNLIYELNIPDNVTHDTYSIVIWYNNHNSVTPDINIDRQKEGDLQVRITYFDVNQKEFIPSWDSNSKKL